MVNFNISEIYPTFLSQLSKKWNNEPNFKKFSKLVRGFSCTNDAAERGVKYASDFYQAITIDKGQHSAMLQGVKMHRRKNPRPQNPSDLFL